MLPPGGVHLLASLPLSINSHMWQRIVCTTFSDCSSWPNKKTTKDKINSQPLTSLIILDLFLHQIPNQWNLTFEDISTTGSKPDDISSLLQFHLVKFAYYHQIKSSSFFSDFMVVKYSATQIHSKWSNTNHFSHKSTDNREVRKLLQICPLKRINDKCPPLVNFCLSW